MASAIFKPELELFQRPTYQTQIEGFSTREYTPIATIQPATPIEFIVAAVEGRMPDLSRSMLYIKAKMVDADGKDLEDDKNMCPVNAPLHSMWSSVEVRLGDTLISDPNGMYPYRAILETLLSYSESAIETQKIGALFIKDTAGQMDDAETTKPDGTNEGLVARYLSFGKSATVEMMDRLHAELFNTDVLLPPGLTIRIRLIPASPAFYMMSADGTACSLRISEARLFVPFKAPSTPALAALELALAKQPVRISMRRVALKHLTIAAGLQTASQDNIIVGRLPKRVVLAMVTESAMSGQYKENPFNFQDFGLNYLVLNVNGDLVPSRPFQPDFSAKRYIREYMALLDALDITHQNRNLAIAYDDFDDGYAIFAFDLSADQAPNDNYYDTRRIGNVRLDIRFSQPLAKAINVILMGEYPGEVAIDKYRNVLLNF